jgi:son of sevenless-like protein
VQSLLKCNNIYQAINLIYPKHNDSGVKYEEPILNVFSTTTNYFNILEWSEIEIARQLTLVTHYLYKSINLRELINSQWTKVDKHKLAPNITKMIDRFNKLSLWITEEILAYDKAKLRSIVIEKFLKLALELKNLNNFNDCLIVITALSSYPIKTLTKSWKSISFDSVEIWKELTTLCSIGHNYAALRDETEKAKDKPCIPYLGLFLKELAFIDEGPKYLKDKRLLNIEKVKKVSKVIQNFLWFKNKDYYLKPVFKLAFLADPDPLNEDQLGDLSGQLGKFVII